MPANKNQHFVPRCMLRPFSLDEAGLAISLYNIKGKRPIRLAPLKSQCARDYLYGKEDLSTEKILADLEGHYSRIVEGLIARGQLSGEDKAWLRLFVLVQQRRTEMAVQQLRDASETLADKAFARAPEQRPTDYRTDTQLMHESLSYAARFSHYIEDLKVTVFRNRTRVDFVICDHPAVMTNRFHFEKLHSHHFGLSSSGLSLSLPLTPRLSAFFYDGQVYSVPNASGTPFIDVTNDNDVEALSELQYLSAAKNVYFNRWKDAESIGQRVEMLAEVRTQIAHKATIYVREDDETPNFGSVRWLRDRDTGQLENYREARPGEELTARETLIAMGFNYPQPSNWPSPLKFRKKPKTFYTGTGVGHVQKAEWLKTRSADTARSAMRLRTLR